MDEQYRYKRKEMKMSLIGKHLAEVSEAMTLLDVKEIQMAAMALGVVKKNYGRVFVFGNGGSHATASHFANDLLKMARVQAFCIGDMQSTMLAYGNDEGWQNMYLSPLREILKAGDGVVGISCSGNSENVVNALSFAADEGVLTVGLTGLSDMSEINELALNALVHVRANDIRVQEDVHLMVCHAIVRVLQGVE